MAELQLITVEFRFRTTEDPKQLADRIEESVRMIVGHEALEEFRWRGLPLDRRSTRRR